MTGVDDDPRTPEQRERERRQVFWEVVLSFAFVIAVLWLCGDWARGQ